MKKKEHKSLLWRILLVLLSFSFSTIVQAQNITVTGNVEDQNGEPLIGVTVAVLYTGFSGMKGASAVGSSPGQNCQKKWQW